MLAAHWADGGQQSQLAVDGLQVAHSAQLPRGRPRSRNSPCRDQRQYRTHYEAAERLGLIWAAQVTLPEGWSLTSLSRAHSALIF